MKVQYSYLQEQFKDYKVIFEKISDVIKTGDYTLGKAVWDFEEKFAALLGSKYAIGVNSGTDALFLSLKALGIGPGDEVITAVNTFIATAGAIAATGARPVYVDVTDEYVIDPNLIDKAITSQTKALLPVHYAGVAADMDKIMDIAHSHALPVVEDSCQAISAMFNGKCVGAFGVTGAFSLHPLKNLNVWGDSGMIITDSDKMNEKLRSLRNHGLRNRNEVDCFGYNTRLDSIQAVVGSHLIEDAQWITDTRIKWAQKLDAALSELADDVTVPKRRPNKRYVHHLYIIMAKQRDELLAHLIDHEIDAKIHYPIPLHLQRCSAHLGYKKGDFPVAEAQAKAIITLPSHQHLDEVQIDYMIETIKAFYG
ncbi:Pleiotropic regulatory protein [Candidatus Desulfarcum epimagneticum]|uniref:Pleiotropic regulatory protein n=1 Tax=uncultured Desulfobacteraceae bacterium TaxID=218296 RepID=A0A484HNL6_9BACT|nr:Pleiotropic regulatory protein [uncultured Desulfobacteraceae bacterium]